ncbi:MAG: transcriptional regulator [Spirochaetes bacterium RIFOXYC1_FULL_54_7]|nr:MAG: transcriptional regulator [Spirochaetes bacterium RIFOXYC1_FULL_54_7]
MAFTSSQLSRLFSPSPILRSRELEQAGMLRIEISRFVAEGNLKRLRRGLYCLPGYKQSEHGDLAIVAKQMPGVLICLITALRYHELTTQAPSEIWIAINRKARAPILDYPALKVLRFSQAMFESGIKTVTIEGVSVKITGIEKTIADCFKFRNTVGLDVALEALKEARQRKLIDQNELWFCAKVARVTNVIRPYLEALA